jgi:predicted transcriptional regulator of viral defense system
MKATDAIMALSHHQGLFRARDLQALGVARAALTGLVHSGRLTRVSRGIYSASERPVSEHDQLAEVALKYPQGVFCLLTALQIHGLTTQSPHEVWLAVDVKARAPVMAYPALRVVRFSGVALTSGVERKSLDGVVQIPVTTVAKTVADCFKYRHKIGLDVALEVLREAWRAKRVTMDELWQSAQICRVAKVMRPYLESLT